MAEELKGMSTNEIGMSRVSKGRKSITYLQKMKQKGQKIVQVCPATLGPWFGMAADLADCDILRIPADGTGHIRDLIDRAVPTIQSYRKFAKSIHINFYMETATYSSKEKALAYAAEYIAEGADSVLPMGVSNETLKYMTDHAVVVYGHTGAWSGWQTMGTGYAKMGKTAESAMRVFREAYEYQENGMGGMTVELVPGEVSAAIAKKLRVPVLGIASGATGGDIDCDGYEMVDMDTFGMMPNPASHAVVYSNLMEFMINTYSAWRDDVRNNVYPKEQHGWHMDPVELEKFNTLVENF